jgi:hypothetical protein
MSRQFMQEKSGSEIVWMPFSSQSWAIYLIQKRHDIEEMTNRLKQLCVKQSSILPVLCPIFPQDVQGKSICVLLYFV